MLRVLQIINTLGSWAGGPPQNAYQLHDALNRRSDVASHLVSVRGDGDPARAAAPAADGSASAPRDPGSRVLRLARLVATADVVLVHGYYVWWIPVVAPVARLLGRSVVAVPHGSLTRHQRRESRLKKRSWELLPGPVVRAAANAFVVQSVSERDELLEEFPGLTVLVGGIGTPLPEVAAERAAPGDGSPNSPVRLLSLSRIAPKKRIDLMIDAVAELRRRGVASRLVVAGTGDDALEADLRRRAERAGIADDVHFVGMLAGDAKEAAFADAQVFLAPSDDENFGISPAEALARGVPLIASTAVASASGLPAAAGVVLADPTGASVADAVQDLMRQDRAALRAGARAFAEANYDWAAVAERWARLLVDVRGDRRVRRSAVWEG